MIPGLPEISGLLVMELLALGVAVGFMAGLLGIGGGMMLVPFVTLLLTNQGIAAGLAVKMAVASSGATILFTSLSSLRAHHSKGMVIWPLVWRFAPGILLGGIAAGLGVFAHIKGQWLAIGFAAFNTFLAWRMWNSSSTTVADHSMPGTAGVLGMGGLIGFLSALVGAGGAFLSVPFMTRCNVPMHKAVGTSSALGFPVAVGSTLGYLLAGKDLTPVLPGAYGYLYLPSVFIVALTSVLLAPVGARAAQRLPVKRLKRIFAVMLIVLAAYVAIKALLD
jgi:uncharacterized protein